MKQINPANEYMAMQPRFCRDFSKIVYVARDEKFLSHTTNYQLKSLSWPLSNNDSENPESENLIDRVPGCPSDE